MHPNEGPVGTYGRSWYCPGEIGLVAKVFSGLVLHTDGFLNTVILTEKGWVIDFCEKFSVIVITVIVRASSPAKSC